MPITGPDVVLYEKKDGIVIITMNRPERLNALVNELRESLADAFERFNNDDDARVAILCGAGRAFCAGRDLKDSDTERRAIPKVKRQTAARRFHDLLERECVKPTIAAIQGYALGGGFRLAKLCDIRIAAEGAEFGIVEPIFNMAPAWVCELTRQMHLGHVLELALWADKRITAERGYEMGWINKVVPKEKLMDEAMAWAERMLYIAPRAVRSLKKMAYEGFYISPEQCGDWGRGLEEGQYDSEDYREGLRAFKERRKPQFKDK